jgi:hypothetical protein
MHETQVPLLDQVEKGKTGRLILLGDGDHQPEVGLDEGALSVFSTADVPAELTLAIGSDVWPYRLQLGAGLVPSLNGLGKPYFVILGEKWVLTDVSEIEPNEIFFVPLNALLRQGAPSLGLARALLTIPAWSRGPGVAESR